MIIETALVELAKAGGTELFISSSESLLKKVKIAKDIKQLFINTGEFFVDYENDAGNIYMILNIYLDPHMMVLFWIQFLMMWMTKEI